MKTICLALLFLIGPLSTMADDDRSPIVTVGEDSDDAHTISRASEEFRRAYALYQESIQHERDARWKEMLDANQKAVDLLPVLNPGEYLSMAPLILMRKAYISRLNNEFKEVHALFHDVAEMTAGKRYEICYYYLARYLQILSSLTMGDLETAQKEYQELEEEFRQEEDPSMVSGRFLSAAGALSSYYFDVGRDEEGKKLSEQILRDCEDLEKRFPEMALSSIFGFHRYFALSNLGRWNEVLKMARKIEIRNSREETPRQETHLLSLCAQASSHSELGDEDALVALTGQIEKKYVPENFADWLSISGMIYCQAVYHMETGKNAEALAALKRYKAYVKDNRIDTFYDIPIRLRYLNAWELFNGHDSAKALEAYSALLDDMKPPQLSTKKSIEPYILRDMTLLYKKTGQTAKMKEMGERLIKGYEQSMSPSQQRLLSQAKDLLEAEVKAVK